MYSLKEIKELIEAVDASGITELEVQGENQASITIRKQTAVPMQSQPIAVQAPEAKTGPEATDKSETQQITDEPASKDENTVEITSPMVGTFYRAPSPDADAYIQIGDVVQNESIVCIVEAMKLMNELESEVSGEVVEILVENGELVDYGQPLFLVKVS